MVRDAIVAVVTPPPEIALLLAAAAPAPPPSFGALCARVLNWRALLDAADHHGLIPLLARAVVSAGPDAAPPAIVESLAASQADAVKRALYYEAELNRLSDAFRRAGLDFIPLKGPTLARALYDDPALRPCSDLDFLVREKDIAAAIRLLGAEGYRLPAHLAALPTETLLALDCEARLAGPLTCVDLQWAVAPRDYPFRFDPEILWRGRPVGGASDLTPAALLFLCVHGTKHAWSRLIWLADIARFIARKPDLAAAGALAAGARCERPLLLALALGKELFGVSPPDSPGAEIENDPAVLRAYRENCARLYCLPPQEPGAFALTAFNVALAPKVWDKLRFCLTLIRAPTEAELQIATLPQQLFFLYYPLRAARFLGKALRRLLP